LGFLTKTAKKVKKATFKKSKKKVCESPKLHKFLWLKNPPKNLLKIQTQKKQTQGFQESFLLVSESKFVLLKTVGVQLFFQKKKQLLVKFYWMKDEVFLKSNAYMLNSGRSSTNAV